jgi:hypothetical protein
LPVAVSSLKLRPSGTAPATVEEQIIPIEWGTQQEDRGALAVADPVRTSCRDVLMG